MMGIPLHLGVDGSSCHRGELVLEDDGAIEGDGRVVGGVEVMEEKEVDYSERGLDVQEPWHNNR